MRFVPTSIALVLYPGCDLHDLAALLQGLRPLEEVARVTTVAERIRPLSTGGSLRLLAERTFAELPSPEILIVPGGATSAVAAMTDRHLTDYLRSAATHAETLAAVGFGALLLAAAGILKGRAATTQAAYAQTLQGLGAHYTAQDLVLDGNLLTASGAQGASRLATALVHRHAPQGEPA